MDCFASLTMTSRVLNCWAHQIAGAHAPSSRRSRPAARTSPRLCRREQRRSRAARNLLSVGQEVDNNPTEPQEITNDHVLENPRRYDASKYRATACVCRRGAGGGVAQGSRARSGSRFTVERPRRGRVLEDFCGAQSRIVQRCARCLDSPEAATSLCRSRGGAIFFFEKCAILFLKIKLRAILYDRLLYSDPSCPSPRRNLTPRFRPRPPRNLRAVQLRRLATAGRRLWIRGRSDMGLWVAHTAHADGLWGLRGFGRSPPLGSIGPPASPDCRSPGSATQWARACDDQGGPSRGAGPAEQDGAPSRPRLRAAAAPLPRRNAGFDGREIFLRATH